LVIAFTMAQKIPAELTVHLVASPGTTATPQDQPTLTVTATVHDAVPVSLQLTTPTGSGSASRPQDHLHVMDNQLHIGIPSSLLTAVGAQWHWSATATSGAAHSQCPAGAGSGRRAGAVVVS
jgi:hypothetical protein